MTIDVTTVPPRLLRELDEARPQRPGHRYTITEVSQICGFSAHTLRWYERIGLMPHVDRTQQGRRRYADADLTWLMFVAKLRLTAMPVADMVRYAELVRAGDHTMRQRQQLLLAHRESVRAQLAELHGTLEVLDFKIEHYGGASRCEAPEGRQS